MRAKVVMPELRATKALTPVPVAKPRRTTPRPRRTTRMEGLGRRSRARRTLAALTSVAFVTTLLVAGTTAGPAAAGAVPGASPGGSISSTGRVSYPYTLVDLGTFGGPNSFQNYPGRSLTDDGTAIGEADTSVADPNAPICFADCTVSPAFEWRNGHLTDLGALPGPNSSCPTWINDRGMVAGVSEYAVDNSAGWTLEDAVLWSHGKLIDLGTLGGNQSDAGAVNDEGQVAGAALNAVPDPVPDSAGVLASTNCAITPINTTEVRAFVWQDGVMHDLGTLGGPDAMASWINDRGQVAGQSFTNSVVNASTGYPTMDPFLSQDGKMIDLGTLGGTSGTANWLTAKGEVVGTSNLAGDLAHHAFAWQNGKMTDLGTLGGTNSEAFFANNARTVVGRADFSPTSSDHHAFLWRNGKMIDLGTVDGDSSSTAVSVNAHDQVVGDSSGGHAWLWQDGSIHDLNTLIAPGSDLSVEAAAFVNDSGEIYGTATLPNGDQHVILLIPNHH
jgi:probable HAF family extracellular repeat protein